MKCEIAYKKLELPITHISSAGDGIRTHVLLRDGVLNPAPLTWLGDPRIWEF